MPAWVREEEKASKNREEKREAQEADKVEIVPEMAVGSLL